MFHLLLDKALHVLVDRGAPSFRHSQLLVSIKQLNLIMIISPLEEMGFVGG